MMKCPSSFTTNMYSTPRRLISHLSSNDTSNRPSIITYKILLRLIDLKECHHRHHLASPPQFPTWFYPHASSSNFIRLQVSDIKHDSTTTGVVGSIISRGPGHCIHQSDHIPASLNVDDDHYHPPLYLREMKCSRHHGTRILPDNPFGGICRDRRARAVRPGVWEVDGWGPVHEEHPGSAAEWPRFCKGNYEALSEYEAGAVYQGY